MIEFDDVRRDAMRELVNISFARGVADLADRLGIHIQLRAPDAQMMESSAVDEILDDLCGGNAVRQMTQSFHSEKFFGDALLVVPAGLASQLVCAMKDTSGFWSDMEDGRIEREVLLEVGNVVVGVCLNKLSEMLEIELQFSAPELLEPRMGHRPRRGADRVIVVSAEFQVYEHQHTGHLLIFHPEGCFRWLVSAIDRFVETATKTR